MSNFGILHSIWCKQNDVKPGKFSKTRGQLVEKMRLEMLGPSVRDRARLMNELRHIRNSPRSQYSCGILFPREWRG